MDGETKTPRCARCRNHGIISRLKGHKKVCPWKQCACSKCILIYERQKLMAAQIEIRREDENTETRLTFPVSLHTCSLHTCIQSNSANSIYKARKIQRGNIFQESTRDDSNAGITNHQLISPPHVFQKEANPSTIKTKYSRRISEMELISSCDALFRMFPEMKREILLLILKGCDYDVSMAIHLLGRRSRVMTSSIHSQEYYPHVSSVYEGGDGLFVAHDKNAFQRIFCRKCQYNNTQSH